MVRTLATGLAVAGLALAVWGPRPIAQAAPPAAPSLAAAAAADRVGFPADYRRFPLVRTANMDRHQLLGTVYANDAAAGVRELSALPYPNGSIVVMEWAKPVTGSDGTKLTDANGLWQRGEVVRLDVMRREAGYGESYGAKRAGDWEFASYTPDGKPFAPAIDAAGCAACHQKASTRDFVYRGRFPALAEP